MFKVDFQTCLANGIIEKDMKIVCPVDETGRFTAEVPDWNGLHVKEADKLIIKNLKEKGNLVKQGEVRPIPFYSTLYNLEKSDYLHLPYKLFEEKALFLKIHKFEKFDWSEVTVVKLILILFTKY